VSPETEYKRVSRLGTTTIASAQFPEDHSSADGTSQLPLSRPSTEARRRSQVNEENASEISKLSLMELIAQRNFIANRKKEAADLFERSAEAVMESSSLSIKLKKTKAAYQLSRALECHLATNDLAGVKRIFEKRYSLNLPPY
jgi:hypothetical protein